MYSVPALQAALADWECYVIVLAERVSPYLIAEELTVGRDVSLVGESAEVAVIAQAGPSQFFRVISVQANATVRLASLRLSGGYYNESAVGTARSLPEVRRTP